MRLRMLSTQRGADDGVTLRTYECGEEYEIGGTPCADELAAVFVRQGWAEEIRARQAAPENASLGEAPENAAEPPPMPPRRRRK